MPVHCTLQYIFNYTVWSLYTEVGVTHRDDDDDDDDKNNKSSNNGSKLVTSTDNGECTMNDTDADGGRRHRHRLDSYQLYNLLESQGAGVSVSLPIYLVYAYVLQQDYHVLRHFDNRRDILDAMEQEKE
jgi:hypothetical protein